jgi:hypothetical protein
MSVSSVPDWDTAAMRIWSKEIPQEPREKDNQARTSEHERSTAAPNGEASRPENKSASSIGVTRRNVSAISAILLGALLSGCRLEKIIIIEHERLKSPPPNCFLKGTRILTTGGYVPIEDIKTDDYAITVNGDARRIRWVGRQSGEFEQGPICFKKGAFTATMPATDLFVSRDHRLFMHGMLIRAQEFINDVSIVSIARSDGAYEYYHLITEGGHAAVLAEGVPCETLQVQTGAHYGFEAVQSDDNLGVFDKPEDACAELFDCFERGKRALLLSHLRSALSPWFELRTRKDVVRDILMEARLNALASSRASKKAA